MKTKELKAGKLRGWIYDLNSGEGLPQHAHDESTAHITIVARGSIVVYWPGRRLSEIVEFGGAVYFAPGVSHRIEAMVDGTKLYNILTGG